MNLDDPVALEVLRSSMVTRLATLSRNGRPSVNPIYFIFINGQVWIGTAKWTLAARNVKADPRVSLLFNDERHPGDRRILRLRGKAKVTMDAEMQRIYAFRVVRKYILTPAGLLNWLSHPRQLWLRRYYDAQSAQKGQSCVIEVTPEQVELVN